jgi:ABC-type spermidine/putrescine transport system permease subunit II
MNEINQAARSRQRARLADGEKPPAPRAALALARSKTYQSAADAPPPAPPGLSLRWYRHLLTDPEWLNAITVSIEVLIPSSIMATLLGWALGATWSSPLL